MRLWASFLVGIFVVSACGKSAKESTKEQLKPTEVQSGYGFLTADTQALQNDDFANPGFLWVDKGEALFTAGEQSCQSCHTDKLTGVAATYPKIDNTSSELLNIEARINTCRQKYQSLHELVYESEKLVALTAYVASQSRGNSTAVDSSGAAQKHYDKGRDYFFSRRGQMNLSCSQCHNDNWGKKLRGDTISQGHGNGFPAYRLEWQSLGSLHRRFRDCDTGVRAEPLPFGSETYVALELYLAARSNGLEMEAPAVRR